MPVRAVSSHNPTASHLLPVVSSVIINSHFAFAPLKWKTVKWKKLLTSQRGTLEMETEKHIENGKHLSRSTIAVEHRSRTIYTFHFRIFGIDCKQRALRMHEGMLSVCTWFCWAKTLSHKHRHSLSLLTLFHPISLSSSTFFIFLKKERFVFIVGTQFQIQMYACALVSDRHVSSNKIHSNTEYKLLRSNYHV